MSRDGWDYAFGYEFRSKWRPSLTAQNKPQAREILELKGGDKVAF